MVQILVAAVIAGLADYGACVWLRSREKGNWAAGVAVAMGLEAMTWVPILLAIQYQDWRIAVACVFGSGVGSGLGLRIKQ